MGKDALSSANIGKHPDQLVLFDGSITNDGSNQHIYPKSADFRYGSNPRQTAALYGDNTFLTTLKWIKASGKEGPSQTNFEDILYAALTVGYFNAPTVAIMKHENPSGVATHYLEDSSETLEQVFRKAFDADFRAAFGGTVFLNRQVDRETADAMRENFVEVVVAPGFDEGVVGKFNGTSTRIFEYDMHVFGRLPKYTGDECEPELKRLPDGSIIRSDVFVSPIRFPVELRQYVASKRTPTDREIEDMHTGYRIRVRSNSVRFVKDGYTTGIGTGQQDRVNCVKIAADKNRDIDILSRILRLSKNHPNWPKGILQYLAAFERAAGVPDKTRAADYTLPGSVLVSDGFFPFPDGIELAHRLGVAAVLAPHGGKNFPDVLAKADEYDMAFVDLPDYMRFFDHH
jgi:phosphoribosylaminoimidazolecarboxamide formyltransferase/IMP cyclohydrolase